MSFSHPGITNFDLGKHRAPHGGLQAHPFEHQAIVEHHKDGLKGRPFLEPFNGHHGIKGFGQIAHPRP